MNHVDLKIKWGFLVPRHAVTVGSVIYLKKKEWVKPAKDVLSSIMHEHEHWGSHTPNAIRELTMHHIWQAKLWEESGFFGILGRWVMGMLSFKCNSDPLRHHAYKYEVSLSRASPKLLNSLLKMDIMNMVSYIENDQELNKHIVYNTPSRYHNLSTSRWWELMI